jgi:hypothetical protein
MRVAIVKSEGYLDGRISRILEMNGIKGDAINKVTRHTISEYDAVIFTYQSNIPNINKVLEQITLEKRIHVLYITNTPSIGQFYNLFEDIFFDFVMEQDLDVILPMVLHHSNKYLKTITSISNKMDLIKDELELLKNTSRAKRILMNKGFSEDESHRYIIDKAMDMRVPKKKIVNLIIENKIDI